MRIISRYASITRGVCNDNGVKTESAGDDFPSFIREIYSLRNISYPKFYKMDDLSKLAFVTSEMLLDGAGIHDRYANNDIGVILAAPHSSLDTDCAHHASITDGKYAPSPAVFVYTLANIMAGEICIRNGFTGENTVFAADSFLDDGIIPYVDALFDSKRIRACVCGEVDFFDKEYSARLFLVEERADDTQDVDSIEFNTDMIKKILY